MVQSGGTAVAGCDVPGAGLGAHMVLWKHPIVKSELHTRALLGSRDSVPLRLKKKSSKTLLNSREMYSRKQSTPIFSYFPLFPSGGRNPLVG